jgi:hypothetical protein
MKYFNYPMSSSLFSSFQENTKCESCFFADTCTRRVPIFVSAKQIYMLSQTYRTVPSVVPYRMLTHSHSATSLYNLSQSAIMLHRVRHLTCERAWFASCYSGMLAILDFKNILNCCYFLAILLSTWKFILIFIW